MSNCDHKNLMGYCMECDKEEIAELKAQLASPMLRCHKAGHQDEIDALKAELKACEIALDGEIKAGDEARSEVAKLREALREIVRLSGVEGVAGDARWKVASRTLEKLGEELEVLKKPKAEAEIKEPRLPRRLTRGKYTFK